MTNQWTGTMIIDEIDRLIVAYEKAKEYLTKITTGIEQQINIWQYRQQIVREQMMQTASSSSYDFLLPKTQRINELTLESVQTLCRTDLLIEQILRIDLKSRLTPPPPPPPVPVVQKLVNGQTPLTLPVPVLRTQNLSRPPSVHSGLSFPHRTSSQIEPPPIYQTKQPRPKEKIPLQRIPAGTKWKQARIDIIDSLSGFYVGNLEQNVQENFLQMQDDLNEHYNDLGQSNQLIPLENPAIGDFGVAKFTEDGNWYRARLIMCEGHQQIKIVFIDFGNIEIKSLKEFFPIDRTFAQLPAQAIACSLSQAYPPMQNENENIWSDETIEIFKREVMNRTVEIHFEHQDDGPIKWPLHFVRIFVNNQSVTNLSSLQKRIDPRPNSFIAEQMTPSLSEHEYILFNVPLDNDDE